MKKRIVAGLLAGGLLAATLPGVASAEPPPSVSKCNLVQRLEVTLQLLTIRKAQAIAQLSPTDDITVGAVIGDGEGPVAECHTP